MLPEKIPMRNTLFGDGAKGYAWQQSRNEESGVQVDAIRKQRGAPWVTTLTSDCLPEREFASFEELREAVAPIEPAPFRAEVLEVEPKGEGSGGCWTCRGEWIHTVRARTGWRAADISRIPTCDACLDATKADPAKAIALRRERKGVREPIYTEAELEQRTRENEARWQVLHKEAMRRVTELLQAPFRPC